jgi:hypothetical protein
MRLRPPRRWNAHWHTDEHLAIRGTFWVPHHAAPSFPFTLPQLGDQARDGCLQSSIINLRFNGHSLNVCLHPTGVPEVRMEPLRLLSGYAPAVLVADVVNGTLIVFIFWDMVAQQLLIVWYLLLLAIVVARA